MADTPPAQVTPPPTFGSNPAPAPEPAAAQPPSPAPLPAEPITQPNAAQNPNDSSVTDPNKPSGPPAVPDKYELKIPEGSYLDQKALERIESYAKTNKLSQAQASEFLNNQDQDVRAIMEERKSQWLEETKSDREIGGQNLQKSVDTARQFLDRHMAPELRQDLDRTGYGNNRHFMKFVLDMAKRSANDQVVMPGQQGSAASEKSMADLFYAETTSKGKY